MDSWTWYWNLDWSRGGWLGEMITLNIFCMHVFYDFSFASNLVVHSNEIKYSFGMIESVGNHFYFSLKTRLSLHSYSFIVSVSVLYAFKYWWWTECLAQSKLSGLRTLICSWFSGYTYNDKNVYPNAQFMSMSLTVYTIESGSASYFITIYVRVMIQLQTLVQTYFVQTDVALIHWLNENIK